MKTIYNGQKIKTNSETIYIGEPNINETLSSGTYIFVACGGTINISSANVKVYAELSPTLKINNTVGAKTYREKYAVGDIFISINSESPAIRFGGTWEQKSNVFLYAAGSFAAGTTGGEATHTLTLNEIPTHGKHIPYGGDSTSGGSANSKFLAERAFDSYGTGGRGWNNLGSEYYPYTFDLGGNKAHNNMPPFIAVYIWQRIA